MKNLTPHQEQLVNDMIAEFSRINPKPSDGGKKRFSIASIDECNQEKRKFLESLAAYNRSFLDNAIEKIRLQLQGFIDEFGEAVGIVEGCGTDFKFGKISDLRSSLYSKPNDSTSPEYVQVTLFPKYIGTLTLSAKCKLADKYMFSFYAGIKCEMKNLVCSNGEVVYSAKYESIWWGRDSYPKNTGWESTKDSLEDFLQSSERMQQAIVRISNIKTDPK